MPVIKGTLYELYRTEHPTPEPLPQSEVKVNCNFGIRKFCLLQSSRVLRVSSSSHHQLPVKRLAPCGCSGDTSPCSGHQHCGHSFPAPSAVSLTWRLHSYTTERVQNVFTHSTISGTLLRNIQRALSPEQCQYSQVLEEAARKTPTFQGLGSTSPTKVSSMGDR